MATGGSVVLSEHPLARAAASGDPMAWVEAAEALAREAEGQLSEEEKHSLAQLMAAKRRAEWLMGRLAAKAAMAQVCHLAPRLMAVSSLPESGAPRPSGPYWAERMGQGWGLSIAHSGGRALAVVAPGAVGCDLEAGESPPPNGWRFFMGPEELAELPAEGPPEGLPMAIWTCKEAAYKALGGVQGGLRALRLREVAHPEKGVVAPDGRQVGVAYGQAFFGAWAIAKPEQASLPEPDEPAL